MLNEQQLQQLFDEFPLWVKTRIGDRYNYTDNTGCAFAQYLQSLGYTNCRVWSDSFVLDTSDVTSYGKMPAHMAGALNYASDYSVETVDTHSFAKLNALLASDTVFDREQVFMSPAELADVLRPYQHPQPLVAGEL